MINEIEEIMKNVNPCLPKQAFCLFFGRGGVFPGLNFINIDVFFPVAVVYLYQEREEGWCSQLAERLRESFSLQRVIFQGRYKRPVEVIFNYGESDSSLVCKENDLLFQIDLNRGQNYGLFTDMKAGRSFVKSFVAEKQLSSVLNLFAYTCAFSVYSASGGANTIVNVDMNRNSLKIGRLNHLLNNQKGNFQYLGHDLYKSFGKIASFGPYNLVIADPPPGQKGSFSVEKDYPALLRRLPRLMAPDGYFLACLNSSFHNSQWLRDQVFKAVPCLRFITSLPQSLYHPEMNPDRGLKILLFQNVPPNEV